MKEIKTGFPHKIMWIPTGWSDLGEAKRYPYSVHVYCGTRIRIGKEGDELFKFCPTCMQVTIEVED